MFERYTERARRVIFFARYEASQLGSGAIETEHLLLGLIREGKVALVDDIGELRARLTRRLDLYLRSAPPPDAFEGVAGVGSREIEGERVTLVLDGSADAVVKEAARYEVLALTSREPDLEDIFLQLYSGDGDEERASDG